MSFNSIFTEDAAQKLKIIDGEYIVLAGRLIAAALILYAVLFVVDFAKRFRDTSVPDPRSLFIEIPLLQSTRDYLLLRSLQNYSVGCAIEIFAHPYLDRHLEDNGWAPEDIEIINTKRSFQSAPELRNIRKKVVNDSDKYCLVDYEFPFSDSSRKLLIRVDQTRWSTLRGVVPAIVKDEFMRHKLINTVPREHKVPHALCLHVVCLTADNRFLALQRSADTWYHPNAFSVSFEEQLSHHDISHGPDRCAEAWFRRALCEEVFPLVGPYDKEPKSTWRTVAADVAFMRMWSCFLEEDSGNISFMGVAKLTLDIEGLVRRCRDLSLEFNSRRDDEGKLHFLEVHEVDGLIRSGHSTATSLFGSRKERMVIDKLHPTTLYRLSMVYRCL